MTNLFFTYRFLYLYIINQVICVKGFFIASELITLNDCPVQIQMTCTRYLRTGRGSPDGSIGMSLECLKPKTESSSCRSKRMKAAVRQRFPFKNH